ncbi:MAG: hypothetical protein IJ880_01800 [Bacilli bacterium]|nr:hypothetical protein [Bacilli bacterium]
MAEKKIFKGVKSGAIRFRNFSGKEGKFNKEGDRNFCILLDPESADEMISEGWNVRFLNPRDDGDEPTPYIQVKVGFGGKGRPPKIVMISKRGQTQIGEDEVNILDWAEIDFADIAINPYHYTVNGKSGVKAYLKTMYVTIVEDEFEDQYYDIPDSAQNVIGDED